MSSVDNRVVSMQFENERFERKVEDTISTLDKLKQSLDFGNQERSFGRLEAAADDMTLSGMAEAVENIAGKFTALGAIGFSVLQNLTSSAMDAGKRMLGSMVDPLVEGGKARALQIEQAKFQFKGLGIDVEAAMKVSNDAVVGTAYSLADAASAAAQFGAAGMKVGPEMQRSLRGIAGVAAMTGSNYSDISQIFTTVAGNGKLMGNQLMQLSTRGVNASAALAKALGKPEAEIRQMVSEGKIDFKTFSDAMDKSFGEHAQSANETFTGALANMHAALARIGAAFQDPLLAGKKNFFNALTPQIDNIKAALAPVIAAFQLLVTVKFNKLIDWLNGINKLTARWAMPAILNGVVNLFNQLGKVLLPIKQAFRDIFPAKTGWEIVVMAKNFELFTEKIKIGAKTVDEIRRVFRGVFAALHIGWTIVKGVFGIFGKLFSLFAGSGAPGGVLEWFAKLGDKLVILDAKLVEGGGLAKWFDALGTAIVAFALVIKGKVLAAFDQLKKVLGITGGALESVSGATTSAFDTIMKRFHIRGALNLFLDGLKLMGKLVGGILKLIWKLGGELKDALNVGNFNTFLDVVNVGLLGGIFVVLKKFLDGDMFKNLGNGILEKIGSLFDNLTKSLQAFQAKLKAEALQKIAVALAVLTASVFVLSMIDSAALAKALTAITIGFGQLVAVMTSMNKFMSGKDAKGMIYLAGALIVLSAAILIMSVAVKVMSTLSWSELLKGLLGVAGILEMIDAFVKSMDKQELGKMGLTLIGVSIAIGILALAVKIFATMSWEELAKGLSGVAIGLATITIALKNMPDDAGKKAASLLVISGALVIMSAAILMLGTMDINTLGQGLLGIAAGFAIMGFALDKMPKDAGPMGAALVVMATALLIMSGAIRVIGTMKLGDIAKGLGAIAVMLLMLGIAAYAMKEAMDGALAMVVMAGALVVMASALKILGAMSWGQILKGLVALAATLLILGLATAAMQPIIIQLIALSVAIVLVGAGFLLFGAGALMAATALSMLAVMGTAAVVVILSTLDGFIKRIPAFVLALADGMLGFVSAILQNAPQIVNSIADLIVLILDKIDMLVPRFTETARIIIDNMLALITDKMPDILAAGMNILHTLLQGIRDNMTQVTDEVVAIFLTFMAALANKADAIVEGGTNLLISFLTGITDHLGRITTAVTWMIIKFITELGNNMFRVTTAGFNTITKFVIGLFNNMKRFVNVGRRVITEFMADITKNVYRLIDAGGRFVVHIIDGIRKGIDKYAPQIRHATLLLVGAILNGITGGLAGKAKDIFGNFAKQGINAMKSVFHINSPSKVTMGMADSVAEGFATGFHKDVTAQREAGKLADRVVTTIGKSLSRVPKSVAGLDDFNPTITPVLDLTDVQKEARRLSGMLGPEKMSANLSYSQAQRISNDTQAEKEAALDVGTPNITEVKFEQTNISPKALSTADIYKQTRSQFTMAKEKLASS